jgi:hypothetical protein
MLLFNVAGVAVIALVSLIAAIISGSILLGWITVVASALGLLLLLVNELHERARGSTDERDAGESPPPPGPEIAGQAEEEPSVAAEASGDDEVLRPEIWPPEQPVQKTRSDGDRVQPRGDALRPDIWP